MDRKELIKKYLDFFKTNNHKEIQNSSLVPENDPTVLFTTAGMHPIVPFLLGEPHTAGKRLCNVQKCIRTGDIEEVGDTCHHTFFEMLGNWSLGDYFKKEAIELSFEFITKILNIPLDRFAVTVFEGNNNAPKDKESAEKWKSLGIKEERIAFLGIKDNWWGPAGETGPCGPDTEMFYWKPNNIPTPKKFNPEDSNWVEIWNDVLMQYIKNNKGSYIEANQKNVDTGMGVERTVAILNGLEDNYLADMWNPIIKKIEKISKKEYKEDSIKTKMRIIADHIKASVFIIADEVLPKNIEHGYVLRRLIRRSIRFGRDLGMKNFTKKIAEPVFEIYDDYKHVQEKKEFILNELEKEENRFLEKIEQGEKILKKIIEKKEDKIINGKTAFLLYQSYGYPFELLKEFAEQNQIKIDEESFKQEEEKHQKMSRTASEGKFKSGLADNSEATTRLHTATHLLNQALRIILKNKDIHQKGSNITPERIRFDFNFDRKLTPEELKDVEDLINKKIKECLPVEMKELTLDEAKKMGAQGIFENKYGNKVKVYLIGKKGKEFSKEICAGPHVSNIKELGHFKIIKEGSSSAGVRRIKAVLE